MSPTGTRVSMAVLLSSSQFPHIWAVKANIGHKIKRDYLSVCSWWYGSESHYSTGTNLPGVECNLPNRKTKKYKVSYSVWWLVTKMGKSFKWDLRDCLTYYWLIIYKYSTTIFLCTLKLTLISFIHYLIIFSVNITLLILLHVTSNIELN